MADLLPDSAAEAIDQMMSHGMTALQVALDHPSDFCFSHGELPPL
jgi:hypothetical protein